VYSEIEIGKQLLVNAALPPKADIRQRIEHVCFVPRADIVFGVSASTTQLSAVVDASGGSPQFARKFLSAILPSQNRRSFHA
jgi:hypothetical protein